MNPRVQNHRYRGDVSQPEKRGKGVNYAARTGSPGVKNGSPGKYASERGFGRATVAGCEDPVRFAARQRDQGGAVFDH